MKEKKLTQENKMMENYGGYNDLIENRERDLKAEVADLKDEVVDLKKEIHDLRFRIDVLNACIDS